jgi:hypothetical protein
MFSRDKRWRQLPSTALWIPGIWLAISSSRPLSFWFEQLGFGGGGSSNLEGRPINVVINTSLFLLALLVLSRRRFSWVQWTLSNKALFSIYAFLLCSMLWSAFPLPTLKRLIQDFGSVLIALIVLTENDPAAALRVIFVRVSYILFPLSVVFIRYFPNIGRQVSGVSGTHLLSGVADHKNSLGQLAMIFCLVLIFDLMQTRDSQRADGRQPERWIRFANLGIGLYLLVISASATSLLCFVTGVTLLFSSTHLAGMKNGRIVFMLGVLTMVALIATQHSSSISEALGRGSGLSGRTEIWAATLAKNTNYWFGAGFRGFWETPEGMSVAQELKTNQLLTAHNGYIEVYLHGGVAALCLLGVWIWSIGLKATAKLVDGEPIGTLAVVFWPLFLIYNLTESQFFQMGPIWFAILLVTMGTPWLHRSEATARMGMAPRAWQRGQRRGRPPALVGAAALQGTMKRRSRN